MHLHEPVLWRGPGELQIGTSGARVLTGLTPGEMDLLLGLTRPCSSEWVSAALAANSIGPARWAELLAALETAPEVREPPTGTVLLLDSHPLTVVAGHILAARGVPVVAAARGQQGPDLVLPTLAPALAILTDAWVTDPVRVGPLMRHDVPHLPLVVGDGVTVGPVVVPGATACTWCLELARTDADPCWPAVATQLRLMREVQTKDPELASSLVAWVVGTFLDRGATRGWRLDDSAILPVAAEPHPRCSHCVTPPCADDPSRA
ncbi:MAG: hypothetical protein ACQERF_02740 [Actinomycetota bacterium]